MKSILKEEKSTDKATILLLQDKIGLLERKNKLLTDQLADYLDISWGYPLHTYKNHVPRKVFEN